MESERQVDIGPDGILRMKVPETVTLEDFVGMVMLVGEMLALVGSSPPVWWTSHRRDLFVHAAYSLLKAAGEDAVQRASTELKKEIQMMVEDEEII